MADYMTEAVEAYHRAHCAARKGAPLVPGEYEAVYSRIEDEWIAEALRAAAPIIERAVRERIVHDLRAKFGVTNRAADWIARGTA